MPREGKLLRATLKCGRCPFPAKQTRLAQAGYALASEFGAGDATSARPQSQFLRSKPVAFQWSDDMFGSGNLFGGVQAAIELFSEPLFLRRKSALKMMWVRV